MRSAIFERWSLLGWLLLGSAGCSSKSMVEVAVPLPELPSGGRAAVVFVQPSSYAEGSYSPVFDHAGRFLGDSQPERWFAVELTAGEYAFYARAQNTAALRASLAPDRTYFVEVASGYGFFKPSVQLLAIAPRFSSWSDRESWVAETRSERRTGSSDLDAEAVADLLARGHEVWADYDASERERRTLYAGDGI